ncbi:hypothetical protein V8C86DRAFT_3028227, partial [Haematococcus lacustris]
YSSKLVHLGLLVVRLRRLAPVLNLLSLLVGAGRPGPIIKAACTSPCAAPRSRQALSYASPHQLGKHGFREARLPAALTLELGLG